MPKHWAESQYIMAAPKSCTVMPAFQPPRPPPPAVDRQCLALVLLTGLRWRGGTERDETTPLVVARQLRAGKESQQVPSETLPLGWAAPRSSRPCLGAATSPSQLRGLFGPRRSPVQESGRIVRVPSRPRVGPPHLRNTNEPNRHHTAGCPGSIRKCRRTRSEWTLTHGPGPDRAMHGRRPCGSQQPRLTVSRLEVRGARRAYEENREKSGKKRKNHQCVAQAQKALANDDAGMRGASCVVRLSHLSPALRLGRFASTRERSSSSDAFAPPLSSRIAVPCDLHGAAASRSSGSCFGAADPLSLSLPPELTPCRIAPSPDGKSERFGMTSGPP